MNDKCQGLHDQPETCGRGADKQWNYPPEPPDEDIDVEIQFGTGNIIMTAKYTVYYRDKVLGECQFIVGNIIMLPSKVKCWRYIDEE